MADDEADGPSSPARPRQPIELAKWPRIGATVAGVIGVGAGGAAVFLTQRDGGRVALLVHGTLLIIVAMVGYVPTRVKWEGKGEVQWLKEQEAVGRSLEAAIETASPGDRAALLNSVQDLLWVAPAAAAAPLNAIAREQVILDVLSSALRDDELFYIGVRAPAGYRVPGGR